jgi:hypothetical protein
MTKLVKDAMTKNWLLCDLQFGSNVNNPPTTLDCGDNFDVRAPSNNAKGIEFYIICCVGGVHMVRKAFLYQ